MTRLTVAQTITRFLAVQRTERDGIEHPLLAGVMGIFGHGNLAGIGEALDAERSYDDGLRYIPVRNEQAMVHTAAAYAKTRARMSTWACTTSVGPGATNLVTGAATATINRLPVLLLPGDVFATHRSGVVLQELEHPGYGDWSVNDCLRPVSRYFHRITRAEQLPDALLQAMRVLTDPAETGAVTLALPQDVQAEAWEVPPALLEPRIWHIGRPAPDGAALERAAHRLCAAQRPLIVAGGGVRYAEASEALAQFVDMLGIPVCETQAGKGSLPFDHPLNLGAIGATGTDAANELAREADVVVGLGTRWSDFTTASRTAFAPNAEFVNCNIAAFDAVKHGGLMLVGDAVATLSALGEALAGTWSARDEWATRAREHARRTQRAIVEFAGARPPRADGLLAQAEVIGAVRDSVGDLGIVVCAAGSLPGDLHRLWRATDSASYHVEYGYSCMGYEIAGGMGVALAAPDRRVVTMVGDGSWLMLSSDLVTAVQEQIPLTVVLIDNTGYGSIGSLSMSVGSGGFGTRHRYADHQGDTSGEPLPVDYVGSARSYGAHAVAVDSLDGLRSALDEASERRGPSVVVVRTHAEVESTPGGAWWDVPVAAVTKSTEVAAARVRHEEGLRNQTAYV